MSYPCISLSLPPPQTATITKYVFILLLFVYGIINILCCFAGLKILLSYYIFIILYQHILYQPPAQPYHASVFNEHLLCARYCSRKSRYTPIQQVETKETRLLSFPLDWPNLITDESETECGLLTELLGSSNGVLHRKWEN